MEKPVERIYRAVAGTPLEERGGAAAEILARTRAGEDAAAGLKGAALRGLARAIASQPESAAFLSHRPALLERIAGLDENSLPERCRTLSTNPPAVTADDLEDSLDVLRLMRREETCFAACCDFGDLASFDEVSEFLSVLAETITQQALALSLEATAASGSARALSVIGMGKIAGREFTHGSDLDLIFLYEGRADEIADASRVGQRLIAYLTTMTGAGVAYAVDTRLRPSGRQGMLVTSCDAFERYQCEEAQLWEHLAMLRARAIAGDVGAAQGVLERVRSRVLPSAENPWEPLAELRHRVEVERGVSEDEIPFKTGAGGLMDVDFLAGGGLLERGADGFPAYPGVPALLRAASGGERIEAVLEAYRCLRRVEASARWVAGRGVEGLRTDESLPLVAELVETGLSADALLARVDAVRGRIREAYAAVIAAGTIDALAG